MKGLSPNDIEFHSTSFCDGNGRLFWSEGELYRGIPEKRAQFTRELFSRGIVEELQTKGFIPRTELTDTSMPGYPVVLRHERIPFVSYAFEWSPSMLRDAALFNLRFLRTLAPHRLTLGGIATVNILFDGSEPRAVDFCDIIEAPRELCWGALDSSFRSYYLRPLELFVRDQGDLARLLQTDYEHGPIQTQFEAATTIVERLPKPALKTWRRGSNAVRRRIKRNSANGFEKKAADWKTRFSQFRFPQKSVDGKLSSRIHEFLERTVSEVAPRSVLIIGGGDDTVALLSKNKAAIVAVDRDERRIGAIYEKARNDHANILPLVVDLRYPAPGFGARNAVLPPALSRLCCDLVIALGLIESLVFRQRLQFDQIVGTFADLSLHRLIVDFPASENPKVVENLRDPYFAWFGLDQFVKALQQHFYSVKVEPVVDGAATILICEKGAH